VEDNERRKIRGDKNMNEIMEGIIKIRRKLRRRKRLNK